MITVHSLGEFVWTITGDGSLRCWRVAPDGSLKEVRPDVALDQGRLV